MPSTTNELRRDGSAVAPASLRVVSRSATAPSRWSGGGLLSESSSAPSKPAVTLGNPTVTLGLIGGQRLLRDATARLLAAEDGLDVLGEFESADHFLAVGMDNQPAVLILDCDGDDPDSYRSAVGMLSAEGVESKLVMLCREMHEEMVRCAIEHRVSGVILKSFSTEDVRAAIEYMATGRTVMPAGWQRALAAPMRQRPGLSPRHREVLALIAQGRRNEEIASELDLSPNTVKFHVRALYSRLGVRNRVEAANQYAQIVSEGY